jgi:hypothetical protein
MTHEEECNKVWAFLDTWKNSVDKDPIILDSVPVAAKVFRFLFSDKPGFRYEGKEYIITREMSQLGVPVAKVTMELSTGNKYLFTTQTTDTQSMWAKLVKLTFEKGQKIQDIKYKIMWIMDLQESDKGKRWMGIMINDILIQFKDGEKKILVYSHLLDKPASPVISAPAPDPEPAIEFGFEKFAEEDINVEDVYADCNIDPEEYAYYTEE